MGSSKTAWVSHLGNSIEYIDGKRYQTRCLRSGSGEKPPLLFLHGIGGHCESFLKNVSPLGQILHDRQVYSIDFIGHGFSEAPVNIPYHLSDYMDHVEDFIHSIGFESAHIFGESLGGAVSARLGLERPRLVETLGLITPAGLHTFEPEGMSEKKQEESDIQVSDLYERTMDMLESGVTRETVAHRLDWLFVDEPDEELVEIRYNIYQREQVQKVMPLIYEAAFVEGYNYCTADDLSSLNVPTLLVHTEHNPSSNPEQAEFAHRQIPDSEYYSLKHSGHWPQYEQPDRFNELVTDFIAD